MDKPDGLIVSLVDKGVNDMRQINNDYPHIKNDPHKLAVMRILADDEVEIRIQSREDLDKYMPITESQGIVPEVTPLPSWDVVTQRTQDWLDRNDNLRGKKVYIYDPYQFMEQFSGLNVVETYTEHEAWRDMESGVLQLLEENETDRQIAEMMADYTDYEWDIRLSMKHTMIAGKTVHDHWMSCRTTLDKARLIKKISRAFNPQVKIQLGGRKGETPSDINFRVEAIKGQEVVVEFDGVLPKHIGKQFFIRDTEDRNVSSSGDPEGSTISLVSIHT